MSLRLQCCWTVGRQSVCYQNRAGFGITAAVRLRASRDTAAGSGSGNDAMQVLFGNASFKFSPDCCIAFEGPREENAQHGLEEGAGAS